MKKNLLILAVFALAFTANAQEQVTDSEAKKPASEIVFDNNGAFSVVVEINATAKQIYTYARAFYAANTPNFRMAATIDDADMCKLQVLCSVKMAGWASNQAERSSIRRVVEIAKHNIDAKDGRFRFKIEDSRFAYHFYIDNSEVYDVQRDTYQEVEAVVLRPGDFHSGRALEYKQFIEKLKAFIEKQIADDDF